MQRKFLTNLLLLLLVNLLVKPFWILGIDRTVQNVVGETYGIYFALLNLTLLLNIVLDVGITNFNNRNVARENDSIALNFSGIVGLKFMLSGVYLIITLGLAAFIGYDSLQVKLLSILVANQILASFILYFRSNISGLHLFKTDSLLSVADRLLMILFCAILLWGNVLSTPFTIKIFAYAQFAAYLITAIISFLLVYKKARGFTLKLNIPFYISILKKTFPYAILILLMSIYTRIDGVMIERLSGKAEASIYASAFRLLDASNQFGYLFAALLLPIFSKMIKQQKRVDELVKLSFSILFSVSFCLAIITLFFNVEIMDLLYTHNVYESAKVLSLLMFSLIPFVTTYVFGTLLTANGSLKVLNRVAVVGVLLNVVLNFALIPKYQAYGATIATVITQGLTAVVQVFIAYKLFTFKVRLRYVLRLGMFILLVMGTAYFINQSVDNKLYSIITIFVLSTIWAMITRLLNVKGMIDIIKLKDKD